MALIMVVDDMAVIREPIAATLRNAGYETVCAAGGAEALSLLSGRTPDLIILDLAMPVIGGMQVLRSLRASKATLQTPVILLTASSEKDVVISAGKLGVRDYVLKSRFSLSELLDRVKKRVAAAPGPRAAGPVAPEPAAPAVATRAATGASDAKPLRLLTRDEAITRAEMALAMKTLPGVVMEVISQADSPRTDSASLAALIGRDSILAARVLQAANSTAYASSRGPVTTLNEAVRNIGCSAVRNVAASVGIFEAMPDNRDENLNLLRCWQHSLATAALCERLASLSNTCPPNVAYLIGLCHDLGEIVFRTTFASEYRQVLDHQARTGLDRESVEREVLGITHRELVGVILGKIGLPDSIRRPIEAMKSASKTDADPAAKLLSLANFYANGLTLCDSVSCEVAPVAKADCRTATGQDDPAVPDGAAFRGEIVALTAVLGRLSAAEERELTKPLIRATATRVWLVRDPAFSVFDPVEGLLSTIARVKVSDRLPEPAEAADIDRVVILTPTTSGAGMANLRELERRRMPVATLWLVGNVDSPVPASAAVQPVSYPTALRTFSDFLSPPVVGPIAT